MKKFLIIWVFVFCSLSLAQYEAANPPQRTIGFGGQLGYFSPADADQGGIMPGILMRAKFSNNMGIEAAFSYRSEEYGNGSVNVTSWPFLASLLFYPVNSVYGLAGIGYYSSSFEYPDVISVQDETKSEFGFHFGAGLEFPVTPGIRIFGDFRYNVLGYDLQQIDQLNMESEVNANYYAINLGGLFMF